MDPPFDLMYGFRGKDAQVDLLTPYEMLLWYQPKRIREPVSEEIESRSTWTAEGAKYFDSCKANRIKGEFKPGVHYVATQAKGRVLLPDLPGLRGLSHRLVDMSRAIGNLASFPFLPNRFFFNLVVQVQIIPFAAF